MYDSGSSKAHNLFILYDSCIPCFKLVYVPSEIDKGLCHLSRIRVFGQNSIFVCIYSAYILNWSQFQGNQKKNTNLKLDILLKMCDFDILGHRY